jgi:hypothetical protein
MDQNKSMMNPTTALGTCIDTSNVTAGKWGSGKELSKMVEAELIPKLEMPLLAL